MGKVQGSQKNTRTAETDIHQEEVIKSGGELKKSVLSYATNF